MGISTIAIILCHAPATMSLPSWLSSILARGGWGVDVFLLLSGLGLYYSLSRCRCETSHLKVWYYSRFKKLLLPYFLCYGTMTILKAIVTDYSWIDVILDISTINFWIKHGSAWFVAMLIPLYLISPFLHKLLNHASNMQNRILLMLGLVCFCLFLSVIGNSDVEYRGLIYNVQFALSRVPSFIVGMAIAPYVASSFQLKRPVLLSLFIVAIALALKFVVPSIAISCFCIIPLVMLCAKFLSYDFKIINHIANFMGQISLESYLFNVTLPLFFTLSTWECMGVCLSYGNYLPYVLVVAVGTILSYIVHRFIIKLFR